MIFTITNIIIIITIIIITKLHNFIFIITIVAFTTTDHFYCHKPMAIIVTLSPLLTSSLPSSNEFEQENIE